MLLNPSAITLTFFNFDAPEIRQMPSAEMLNENWQTASAELEKLFFKASFSHYVAIIKAIGPLNNRLFYLKKCASEYWNYDTLI